MIMLNRLATILGCLALSVWLVIGQIGPAPAQYIDHATWGGISGGTANAQTLTIDNYDRNEPGVPIRFLPGVANTSGATLNISGVGAVTIKLKTAAGLVNLVGGELFTQIATVTFDGTYFELDPP